MPIDFLLSRFSDCRDRTALVWNGHAYTYSDLLERISHWSAELARLAVEPGNVVSLEGDFSPNSIALFLALVGRRCIVIPQSNISRVGRERKDAIAQVEWDFKVDGEDRVTHEKLPMRADHPLYEVLRSRSDPGLVLFSSGTSGDPKAAVHDFIFLLEKFATPRPAMTTLNFLLFDHWGGLNTLLHALANGATVVTVRDRSPEAVCALIEKFKVELLPSTPTFLNLLLISGACSRFDLSSIKVISYGAEPMPQNTLDRLAAAFPRARLQQTYGLIELGVLRSKSRGDGSLWVKIGGEGFETRIVDGILQIKTKSTIIGYLNAPTPLTADGWFITGDAVLQDGDYVKILGRKSELINVGGEKVYPTEVENIIQAMENVSDVTVFGEKNPFVGNIVCAKVTPVAPCDPKELSQAIKKHCLERMDKFKVPVKVEILEPSGPGHFGDRFKKIRNQKKAEEIS